MVINDERAETLGNAHISGIMRRSQYALLSFPFAKNGAARARRRGIRTKCLKLFDSAFGIQDGSGRSATMSGIRRFQ